MTQPPNQPPQGGFGAPQEPPPGGGFGAPQEPPPGGGFGAPQTPPSPPQGPPQPGYGYPQQPGPYNSGPYASGPYGQPQQPGPYGQQPGYGYPPQPQFPGAPGTPPPGGSGSRNPFTGKPAMIIGAAVAALLVVGGTVWAVSGDDGKKDEKPVAQQTDDPEPGGSSGAPVNPGDGSGDGGEDPEDLNKGRQAGESKVLWYKEAPDAPGSGAEAPGMWITDKTAVKAAYKELVAYNVGDGRPTWDTITFPQEICAVTRGKTADGKVVIAYKSGKSDSAKCNQLQLVDLDTGQKGWKQEVPDGALFDSALTIEMTLTGNTLMVGRSQSGTAYDVTDGKKLFDARKYGDAPCFPAAFAGGERLLQVASCGAGGTNEHDELQELDPKTGKVKWTQKFDKGWRIERTYSVDPVVVYSTNEEKKAWNISAFTGGSGKFRSEVTVDEDFAPGCDWAILARDLQGCEGAVADGNTLYLPTKATTGANEIVAISLDNGKERWRVKSPVEESMQPMKIEGGKLIVYVEPSYDAGGQVVAIPVGGGDHKPAGLMRNPQGVADIENSFFSKSIDWVDGRFYISTTRLTGNDDAKEKLMLAYGK